jgi:membrane protease YdiL (CAAX protease family)
VLARALALLRDHPLLTPLLVVYAAILVLGGIFEFGPLLALVNLVLLAAYVSAIHIATRGRQLAIPAADLANRRSRDIGLAITVAVLQLAAVSVVWFVILPKLYFPVSSGHLRAVGLPDLVAAKAANAALTVPFLLLPTLVAIAVFRVSPRDVGLTASPRDLALGVVLAAISVGLGVGAVAAGNHPGLMWESAPLPTVTVAIALQSLINGVPEELAFRGVIFGRLMPWLGRPGNSLTISTMVFGLYHVPSLVASSHLPPWEALLVAVFGALQGLVFGYLFYRTRSIWPGAIWHTSVTGVGVMFA